MKLALLFASIMMIPAAFAFTGDGMPFKYISSCELDLNGDQVSDKAMLVEGLKGRELIALIAKGKSYDAFVVSSGKENMFLNCKLGSEVKETIAGGGKGRTIKTPGAYLELIKPESSAVAFIWNKKSFQEIWTAD